MFTLAPGPTLLSSDLHSMALVPVQCTTLRDQHVQVIQSEEAHTLQHAILQYAIDMILLTSEQSWLRQNSAEEPKAMI